MFTVINIVEKICAKDTVPSEASNCNHLFCKKKKKKKYTGLRHSEDAPIKF